MAVPKLQELRLINNANIAFDNICTYLEKNNNILQLYIKRGHCWDVSNLSALIIPNVRELYIDCFILTEIELNSFEHLEHLSIKLYNYNMEVLLNVLANHNKIKHMNLSFDLTLLEQKLLSRFTNLETIKLKQHTIDPELFNWLALLPKL